MIIGNTGEKVYDISLDDGEAMVFVNRDGGMEGLCSCRPEEIQTPKGPGYHARFGFSAYENGKPAQLFISDKPRKGTALDTDESIEDFYERFCAEIPAMLDATEGTPDHRIVQLLANKDLVKKCLARTKSPKTAVIITRNGDMGIEL